MNTIMPACGSIIDSINNLLDEVTKLKASERRTSFESRRNVVRLIDIETKLRKGRDAIDSAIELSIGITEKE